MLLRNVYRKKKYLRNIFNLAKKIKEIAPIPNFLISDNLNLKTLIDLNLK